MHGSKSKRVEGEGEDVTLCLELLVSGRGEVGGECRCGIGDAITVTRGLKAPFHMQFSSLQRMKQHYLLQKSGLSVFQNIALIIFDASWYGAKHMVPVLLIHTSNSRGKNRD